MSVREILDRQQIDSVCVGVRDRESVCQFQGKRDRERERWKKVECEISRVRWQRNLTRLFESHLMFQNYCSALDSMTLKSCLRVWVAFDFNTSITCQVSSLLSLFSAGSHNEADILTICDHTSDLHSLEF